MNDKKQDIATKYANIALSVIANRQMTTWAKPTPYGCGHDAFDIVRQAISEAITEWSEP